MADAEHADEGGGGNPFHIDVIFWALLGILIIQGIMWFFGNALNIHPDFTNWISTFFDILKGLQFLAIFSSLVFIFGLVFIHQKMKQFSHHGHGHSHGDEAHAGGHDSHTHDSHAVDTVKVSHGEHPISKTAQSLAQKTNQKWKNILGLIDSENTNDWRLAIIEADALLDDMLKKIGYEGETMGERLKEVNRSEFKSIDSAWQAHRIRNAIAHEGSDFKMTKREAVRVIGLYEEVFKEFYLI